MLSLSLSLSQREKEALRDRPSRRLLTELSESQTESASVHEQESTDLAKTTNSTQPLHHSTSLTSALP